MEKVRNDSQLHFLLYPQRFKNVSSPASLKVGKVWKMLKCKKTTTLTPSQSGSEVSIQLEHVNTVRLYEQLLRFTSLTSTAYFRMIPFGFVGLRHVKYKLRAFVSMFKSCTSSGAVNWGKKND